MVKGFILMLSLVMVPLVSIAGSVGPVFKVNTAGEKSGVLTISNNGPDCSYQITVDELTVENGASRRSASSKIRFAPSIVTVKKGATQSIRYIKAEQSGSEEFFRVSVAELPAPGEVGLIKLVKQDLAWIWRSPTAQPNLSGRWVGEHFEVTNTGTASARLVSPSSGSATRSGLLGYVLPGETRKFALENFPHGVVSVEVNGQRRDIK